MRYRRSSLPLAALVVAVAALGCGTRKETPPAGTTQVSESARAQVVTQAGGALARRAEAQDHFDAARRGFVDKDFATAAKQLREGAKFLSDESRLAVGDAVTALDTAAARLTRVADDVERGVVTNPKTLDRAFARANHAEALKHFLAAREAWAKSDSAATAEELVMAADHFERAAKDAVMPLAPAEKQIVRDSRSVASFLEKRTTAAAVDTEKTMSELGKAIERIGKAIR